MERTVSRSTSWNILGCLPVIPVRGWFLYHWTPLLVPASSSVTRLQDRDWFPKQSGRGLRLWRLKWRCTLAFWHQFYLLVLDSQQAKVTRQMTMFHIFSSLHHGYWFWIQPTWLSELSWDPLGASLANWIVSTGTITALAWPWCLKTSVLLLLSFPRLTWILSLETEPCWLTIWRTTTWPLIYVHVHLSTPERQRIVDIM